MQAEVAAFIVAQAIPVLRVLMTSKGTTGRQSQQGLTRASVRKVANAPATAIDEGDIDLFQLPSGKIVRADSEEVKAYEHSKEGGTSLAITQLPATAQDPSAEAFTSTQAQAPAETNALLLQSWRYNEQML